jgi:hypothetical protein
MRRFPPPWTIEALEGSFKVVDSNGQALFLTVFLFQHADPHGDGMEMAGVAFAFMLIFLPFTLPAFVLARNGRWLVPAAFLAALGAFAYLGL